MNLVKNNCFILLSLVLFVSCKVSHNILLAPDTDSMGSLQFLGQKDISFNFIYNNTTVGGLSSIDYDAADKTYYLISDDRSAINPARFYKAAISFTKNGIDSIQFTGVYSLLQLNGTPYPNSKTDPYHTPDPEAMRYNAITKQLTWSSEGERIVKVGDTVLEDPAINIITTAGNFIDSFKMPDNLVMQSVEKGPRQNGVLEGLAFADNYKTLFAAVEEPLYEDGARVDVVENNTYTRILKYDVSSKENTAQFAYKPDRIAYPANPSNGFKINGIPDILSIGNNKLLVIERSYSTGRIACTIKVFVADLTHATNIKNMPLKNAAGAFVPATKKLLINMDDIGTYIDNIEGITFGPNLPNGHKTLLFVADNNFNPLQKSQLLLFEVIP